MFDYCDCRSHPQIASLSADHEVMLGLLGELVRAARRRTSCSRLASGRASMPS